MNELPQEDPPIDDVIDIHPPEGATLEDEEGPENPKALQEEVEELAKRLKARREQQRIQQLKQERGRLQAELAKLDEEEVKHIAEVDTTRQEMREDPWGFSLPDDEVSVAESSVGATIAGKPDNTKEKKLMSGIAAKATDRVKCPQVWPHVTLQDEYVSQELRFQDLDFRLLVAGELEIIGMNMGSADSKGRLELLKHLAYILGVYEWNVVQNVYVAIVRKIELGILTWRDSFHSQIQWLLAKQQLAITAGSGKKLMGKTSRKDKTTNFYCPEFQKGTCEHAESHSGAFAGRQVLLQHVRSLLA